MKKYTKRLKRLEHGTASDDTPVIIIRWPWDEPKKNGKPSTMPAEVEIIMNWGD